LVGAGFAFLVGSLGHFVGAVVVIVGQDGVGRVGGFFGGFVDLFGLGEVTPVVVDCVVNRFPKSHHHRRRRSAQTNQHNDQVGDLRGKQEP